MATSMGVVAKLADKAKRQAIARSYGTCKPFSAASISNMPANVKPGLAEVRLATRTANPKRADYVRHVGKWKHYV